MVNNKKEKNKKLDKKLEKNIKSKKITEELKKVTWPTTSELVKSTTAVIVIVLVMVAIIFLCDSLFTFSSNKFIDVIKTRQINKEKKDESKPEVKTEIKEEKKETETKQENVTTNQEQQNN